MKAALRTTAVFVCMICLACITPGCKKSKKMDVPTIKMITRENINALSMPDRQHIWFVGAHGCIYHSPDGGSSWMEQDSKIEHLLSDVQFIDSRTGWATGIYGTILHTADGGKNWDAQNSGTKRHLFGISFVDKENGWAIGEWNTILHTADGGRTWQQQVEEQDRIYSDVHFVNPREGWVIGERGFIMHTSDAGQTWQRQMPESFERATIEEQFEHPRPYLFGLYFADNSTGWICGLEATILKTTDGGKTWKDLPSESEYAIYSISVKGDRGWAVGDKGAYLLSTDGGNTWKIQHDVIKSKQWFADVCFSDGQNGWVVGQTGIVVHTTDAGDSWTFESGMSYTMEFFEMPKVLEFRGLPHFGPFERE